MRRYFIQFVGAWLIILSLSLILTACKTNPTIQPTAETVVPNEGSTSEPAPTATLMPSDTPVPEQRKVVLLGTQEQSGEISYEDIRATLQELATQDGLMFEALPSLEPGDLTSRLAVVVALPPDPGIAGLVAAGPDTQFLTIGIAGLKPAGNLSIIGGDGAITDEQGFVAGYMAAVISEQWRMGMIVASDSDQGSTARQGFINGVTYYCGLCRSPYPPFYTYPILADLPSTATSIEAQAAAKTIISQAVNTVFIFPAAHDPVMLESLAQAGLAIIGVSQPPASISENWAATVLADPLPAVRQVWPELLAGRGGIERSLEVRLVDRNERLFSPGRQHLVDEFLADLQAGFIDTGVSEGVP